MNDNQVTVENIIYGSFVKMNRLEKIVFDTFSNTSIAGATNLNIFVDLYSILKSIFSESSRTDITDYTAITSGIINLCAHYRSFFKKLSVSTKFFLVMSFNTCEINGKFVAGYNNIFKNKSEIKVFKQLAENNFALLELLCPYLPDIHFIKSDRNYESTIIMSHIMDILNDGQPNLIISKDIYPMQLLYTHPYTSYLYPLKRRGGIDESIMIPIWEKLNFREEFWKIIAFKRSISLDTISNISPINFPVLCALTRFPERNIGNLLNVKNAVRIIKELADTQDIKIIPAMLYKYFANDNIPLALIDQRIKALDFSYIKEYYKQDLEPAKIKFENLYDSAKLNQINAKFFPNNPLELQKL